MHVYTLHHWGPTMYICVLIGAQTHTRTAHTHSQQRLMNCYWLYMYHILITKTHCTWYIHVSTCIHVHVRVYSYYKHTTSRHGNNTTEWSNKMQLAQSRLFVWNIHVHIYSACCSYYTCSCWMVIELNTWGIYYSYHYPCLLASKNKTSTRT